MHTKDREILHTLIEQIELEMDRANNMWGKDFDDKNTLNDWIAFINYYLSKAVAMGISKEDREKYMRKACGLAINTFIRVRTNSLAPRHYENQTRPISPPEINERLSV